MAEAQANVAQGDAGKPTEPKADATAAKLAEYEAKLASYEAAEKKRKDESKVADGKAKELLAEKSLELDSISARLAEYEKKEKARVAAQTERINAMIEKLPEGVREEVKFVSDGMDPDKLEKFVGMKLGTVSHATTINAPPSASGASGGGKAKDPVSPEQEKIMRKAGAKPTAFDMAKFGMKGFQREGDEGSITVYRYKGTGDDEADSHELINALRARAFGKSRPTQEEMRTYMGFPK